jgi:hypothetical protein
VGPTYQPGVERGKSDLRWGRFPVMEAKTRPTGPMERGGGPRKSGPAWKV